jgi:hypothetical protein
MPDLAPESQLVVAALILVIVLGVAVWWNERKK